MITEAISNEFLAAHHAKDLNKMTALLSDQLEFTTLLGTLGKRDYLDFARGLLDAMPDLRFQAETVAVSGGDVLLKFGLQGTHANTFTLHAPGMKPLPPTNKRIALQPDLLHYTVSPTTKQITRIYPEPGHEGGVVYLLTEMGAKLPPLWLARLINRLARFLKR